MRLCLLSCLFNLGGCIMKQRLTDLLVDNREAVTNIWLNVMKETREENYQNISKELYEITNLEFATVIHENLNNSKSSEAFEEFAEKVMDLGWPLSYITDGLGSYRRVTIDFIICERESVDAAFNTEVAKQIDEWIAPIIRHLVNSYSGNWESIVSLQRVALQELSAPLIPVLDRVTVMPLIGTIDTDRAKQIMESLLEGVIKHNAEVVLIDITGVPVVDTMVAHHVIQAAEAVRLIGSKCILVGIRPEIAQTIVNLGIDLDKFMTKSSLQKGFHAALELTNRKVVETEDHRNTINQLLE